MSAWLPGGGRGAVYLVLRGKYKLGVPQTWQLTISLCRLGIPLDTHNKAMELGIKMAAHPTRDTSPCLINLVCMYLHTPNSSLSHSHTHSHTHIHKHTHTHTHTQQLGVSRGVKEYGNLILLSNSMKNKVAGQINQPSSAI